MKIYGYVALAVILLAGMKWAHSAIYNSGYNAAVTEQSAELDRIKNEAVAKARKQWENTTVIADAAIVVEERIVEVVRTVEKEIPKIVERIVEVAPACSDLGPEFAGLLNQQARAGSGGSMVGSDATTESNP